MYGAPADLYPGIGQLLVNAHVRGSMLPLHNWLDTVLTVVDIPLTFAFDTVMLPIDLLYSGMNALSAGEEQAPKPPGFQRQRDLVPEEIGRRP